MTVVTTGKMAICTRWEPSFVLGIHPVQTIQYKCESHICTRCPVRQHLSPPLSASPVRHPLCHYHFFLLPPKSTISYNNHIEITRIHQESRCRRKKKETRKLMQAKNRSQGTMAAAPPPTLMVMPPVRPASQGPRWPSLLRALSCRQGPRPGLLCTARSSLAAVLSKPCTLPPAAGAEPCPCAGRARLSPAVSSRRPYERRKRGVR
jgi:hypothetical protein